MSMLALLIGVVILSVTAVDLVTTTTSVSSGRGFISSRVAARCWRSVLALHRRTPRGVDLRGAGATNLFGVILTWLLLFCVGWALVFTPTEALDGDLTLARRLHFAAVLVGGRGSTPLDLAGPRWWIAEQMAGFTGIALISLSIAYVLPVVGAVASMRHVAASVTQLGPTSADLLASWWDGDGFGDLDLHLIDLAGMLNVTTQHHLAYPVVYYFHSPYRDFALAPSVVVLDETLTIIEHGLAAPPAMSSSAWKPTRAALDQLLTVVRDGPVRLHDEAPPVPSLAGLARLGIEVVDQETFDEAVADLVERRRLLRGLLAFEGREWPPAADLDADDPEDAGATDEGADDTTAGSSGEDRPASGSGSQERSAA